MTSSVTSPIAVSLRLLRLLCLTLLPLCPLPAQHITFSPDSTQRLPLHTTVWHIIACLPPGSAHATLPAGLLFQHLALHGSSPLSNAEALDVFHGRQIRSLASRFVEWSGYAAVAGGYLMTASVVRVSPQIQISVSTAGGFLSVLVPLALRKIPGPSAVEGELIGAWLQIPAGGCGGGVMLGGPGVAFEVLE